MLTEVLVELRVPSSTACRKFNKKIVFSLYFNYLARVNLDRPKTPYVELFACQDRSCIARVYCFHTGSLQQIAIKNIQFGIFAVLENYNSQNIDAGASLTP